MNIETLRTKVSGVIDSEYCGAEFYFLLATGDTFALRRADLTFEAQTALTDYFAEALRSAMNASSVIGISAADDRTGCIYSYDIQHVPELLFQLTAVLDSSGDDYERFDFSRESLKLLKGIIVLLGHEEKQLTLYRHHYPIFLFEKDTGLFTGLAEGRLRPLEDDVLRISPTVDFLCIDGEYYIFNLKLLERSFGFQEAIRSLATKGLQSIAASGLIADAAVLQERVCGHDVRPQTRQGGGSIARPEQSPQQGHRRLYSVASGSPGKNSRRRRKHKVDADDQSVSRHFLETAERRFSAIRANPPLLREPGEGCCIVAYSSASLDAFNRQMKTTFPQ